MATQIGRLSAVAWLGLASAALALNYRAVDVTLRFGTGPLTVGMNTKASPTLGASRPTLRGDVAYVGASHGVGNWNVELSPRLPLALHIQQETGSADLNLRGLPLTALSLSMGTGPVTLKLPSATFAGQIKQGTGQLDIYVPADTGVRLKVMSFGMGSLDVGGKNVGAGSDLTGTYQTGNFESAQRKITLTLNWGSGPVNVHTPGQ